MSGSEHIDAHTPLRSVLVSDAFAERLTECHSGPLLVADFASGENHEVPLFVATLHEHVRLNDGESSMPVTYCLDAHVLRLESLFYKLQESGVLESSRVVEARFETMLHQARFPEVQKDYLTSREHALTAVDTTILESGRLTEGVFDIAFLNNDVLGYLFEYYAHYADAERSLRQMRATIVSRGLLVVTQPCLLYTIDNMEVLSAAGFSYLEGYDIDWSSRTVRRLETPSHTESWDRARHYRFLLFEAV
ncbi:MAG: hypothetical protein HXY34_00690 [Candidatus Thorarchaeota archaeon]|nr:hypothetical protein [Candidatus Thorarchaeota archaeon]